MEAQVKKYNDIIYSLEILYTNEESTRIDNLTIRIDNLTEEDCVKLIEVFNSSIENNKMFVEFRTEAFVDDDNNEYGFRCYVVRTDLIIGITVERND